MFTLHPFKQAEIDRKKSDDLRKRTILEYNLKIDFMKFQSVFINQNIEGQNSSNSTNRTQEILLNDQIVEKIRQQKLYYQNEQLKIQQKFLITKILETGSSKFHYLKNEFPKYSLYVIIDEYDDSLLIEYYKKVKENKEKLDIIQDKLTEFIKLLNISKIQEEKKSKDEQLKSKFYKEQKNKKKSDQFFLSNKITIEIIKYVDQLISNLQNQQAQINESERLSKKVCFLFINEEILNMNEIIKKIKKYFQNADEIESVDKFKKEFSLISTKWKNARNDFKKYEEKISKEKNKIEIQKIENKMYILNNDIKHIKSEIAYFYVELIIFCNDDSKENLNKLLEEYKNLNIQLKSLTNKKKCRKIQMKIQRNDGIILDLETKIEADYYDKNNNTLYKDILVSAMTLIKGENNNRHSKSLMSVIIDRIKKKVEDKIKNDYHDFDWINTRFSQKFIERSIGIQEKLNYNEDNLVLYQFIKPEQYDEVIKILTKKRSLKVSESKQNHIVTDKCDSEIRIIDKMLNKLNKLNDYEKMEEEDVEPSIKSEQENEEMMEEEEEDVEPSIKSEQGNEKMIENVHIPIENINKTHKKQDNNEEIMQTDSSINDTTNHNSSINSNTNNNDDYSEISTNTVGFDGSSTNTIGFSESATNISDYSDAIDINDIEGCPKINLEDYEIKNFLTKGGYGSIDIAVDRTTNKEVVIKSFSYKIPRKDIIRIVKISNTDIIGLAKTIGYHFALINEEIMHYKNKIKNFNEYPHNGCIVMNLYRNDILDYCNKEYLNSNGQIHNKINPTIRSKIIFGVAAIMKKLHEKQIVHRDLKISNILLNNNNEPIICDFDLSYNVNDECFEKILKQDILLQGTPYYISPEKINNEEDKTNTFASDVYSYAMILYFMFSTSINFSNNNKDNPFVLYKNIVQGMRPIRPKNIPEHYWKLIQMCWDGNPYNRPTFEDITDILKDDKYALNEFGMETDIDELHEYQRKLGEYNEPVLFFI